MCLHLIIYGKKVKNNLEIIIAKNEQKLNVVLMALFLNCLAFKTSINFNKLFKFGELLKKSAITLEEFDLNKMIKFADNLDVEEFCLFI